MNSTKIRKRKLNTKAEGIKLRNKKMAERSEFDFWIYNSGLPLTSFHNSGSVSRHFQPKSKFKS